MFGKLFTDAQLRTKDIDALKQLLRPQLDDYVVAIKDVRAGNRIFRGVKWDARPDAVAQLGYPPAAVARMGRANRDGQSAFYASLGGPAILFELKAKRGDLIALGEWEITEPLWMHNLGFDEVALRALGDRLYPRPQLTNLIPNETSRNRKLRRKLSKAFTENLTPENEYRYKQSIAITELLFDGASPLPVHHPGGSRFPQAAGIVYPAMQMRGAADTVMLFPTYVDTSLKIRTARYVLVEDCDLGCGSYSVLNLAISKSFSGGMIQWTEMLGDEKDRRSTIAMEDDRWVLRNGHGQIYFAH